MAKRQKNIVDPGKKLPPRKKSRQYHPPYRDIGVLTFLLVLTFVIFSPIRDAQFVYWDDDRNITENPQVMADLSIESTKDIFTTPVIGNYNPLANWTFALEKKLFVDSRKYPTKDLLMNRFSSVVHLDNLLLHLLNIILLWFLIRALGFSLFTAGIASFLFALHPLHVESVAWATERKDVLFSLFFLSSTLTWYLAKYRHKGKGYEMISVLLFTIGLFAKIQMVTLPLTLLVIDYYKGGLKGVKTILDKWIYFILALLFGVLGIYFLADQGSLSTNATFNSFQRLFIGMYSLSVYLIKSVLPYQLSALYPYPADLTLWHYLSALSFLSFFAALFYAYRRKLTPLVFGLSWFFVNIMFLLQFFGAGQGYIADRFTYIPYIGLFIIFGYYLEKGILLGMKWKSIILALTTIWLLGLLWMSKRQVRVWDNTVTLFTQVIDQFPKTMTPYRNRGNYYRDNGMTQEALADYSRGLSLKPDAEMYNSRGKLYFTQGAIPKAIEDYKNAIKLEPDDGEYYINLGATYAKNKSFDQALEAINKGLQRSPGNTNAYLNRSIIYMLNGEYEKQIQDLNAYLKVHPEAADIRYEMGRALLRLSAFQKAVEAFTTAIKYSTKGEYYHERAKAYASLGNLTAARNDAQIALKKGINIHPKLQELLNQ